MQLFILLLVALNVIPSSNEVLESPIVDNDVVIEIMNPEAITFQFSITYEARRKIIKVRSEQSIKSLRTVDAATNSHKGYNVAGSDLIILPKSDFSVGSYVAEIKFDKTELVVLAKIHVTEAPIVNG